jgi:hypothetical protein
MLMKIGYTLTKLTEPEQAEIYRRGILNISSKSFLSSVVEVLSVILPPLRFLLSQS